MQMNICLRDLPTRKKSTLPSRVPTHAYADCKISGQQPTQLYKEFPRVHEVGHWEKNDAHMDFFPLDIHNQLRDQIDLEVFEECKNRIELGVPQILTSLGTGWVWTHLSFGLSPFPVIATTGFHF